MNLSLYIIYGWNINLIIKCAIVLCMLYELFDPPTNKEKGKVHVWIGRVIYLKGFKKNKNL